jgi:hypothetical protein
LLLLLALLLSLAPLLLSLFGDFLLPLLFHLSLLGLFLRGAGLFLLLLLRLLLGQRRLLSFTRSLGGFALLLLLLFRLLASHRGLLGFSGLLGLLFQLFFLGSFLLTAVHRFLLSCTSLLGLLLKLLLAGLFLLLLLSCLLLFQCGGLCLLFFPLFLAGQLFLLAELRRLLRHFASGIGLGRFFLRTLFPHLLFLAGSHLRLGGFARLLDGGRCLFLRLAGNSGFLGFGSLGGGLILLLSNLLLAGQLFLLATLHRFLPHFTGGINFRRFLLRPLFPHLLFLARSHFRLRSFAGLIDGRWYFRLRRRGADRRLPGRHTGCFGTAWALAARFALRD